MLVKNATVIGDIGNSSAKIIYIGRGRITRTVHTIINKLITLPEFVRDKDLDEVVENLHDDLIIEISSPSIAQEGYYAIGSKAFMVKDGVKSTFDINTVSKQEHDISVIIPSALVSTSAIQDYYAEHKELPESLQIEVDYRTALPLKGYVQDRVDTLKNRLVNTTHQVKVLVQGEFVPVEVKYTDAKVVQEGLPTVYALLLVDVLMSKYKLQSVDLLERNVLSLDIGEGTTEANFVSHGEIDNDSSEGEVRGVGHAALRAIKKYLEILDLDFEMSRQEFMKVVRDDKHSKHKIANKVLEEANEAEAHRILDFVKRRYNVLQANVQVIIVSGGGATVFRKALEPLLKEFCEIRDIELIWIDEEYADMMNCFGLNAMLQKEVQEANQSTAEESKETTKESV